MNDEIITTNLYNNLTLYQIDSKKKFKLFLIHLILIDLLFLDGLKKLNLIKMFIIITFLH